MKILQEYDEHLRADTAARSSSSSSESKLSDKSDSELDNLLPAWGDTPNSATSICSRTFILPDDVPLLRKLVNAGLTTTPSTLSTGEKRTEFFICKPNAGSQGRGVQVVRGLDGVLAMYDASLLEPEEKKDPDFDGKWGGSGIHLQSVVVQREKV